MTIDNPQLQLAFDFVQYTGSNVFLTGKAGTGKTTFLHRIRNSAIKRMIVVAPTGVAAINAGGVTIHSFFQMPFGPYIPRELSVNQTEDPQSFQRFNREKINIIKSLDLLVIDEISMVRADLLDGIDDVLRRYKDRYKPFGGVQLLMIGDLQQLAPVIKDDEWEILKKYYDTGFFFSSRALQKTNYISVELKHIYRQSDHTFIDLLNKVRANQMDEETITALNRRYIPNFSHGTDDGYITLTTHNYQAQEINSSKLKGLEAKPQSFRAIINDDFPEYAYPTDFELILKVGAQVMFVKNDTSRDKLYYNGKIGKIVDIDEDTIYVKCPTDEDEIPVQKAEWQNAKYTIDEDTKEIQETVAGTFVQYPLKLAWAITIHKSQGLTFEKAIIDARSSFAHGQVYVALSRCKTLEGMVLCTPIEKQSVKSDSSVFSFTRSVEQNQPTSAQLEQSRNDYQLMLLKELVDFSVIQRRLNYCNKLLNEHRASIHLSLIDAFDQMATKVRAELQEISDKFKIQIQQYIGQEPNIEMNLPLQERIKKACIYFTDKMEGVIRQVLHGLVIDIDNKTVRKSVIEALGRLKEETTVKLACLTVCQSGFVVKKYLETRAKSAIEKPEPKSAKKTSEEQIPSQLKHFKLYSVLKEWRKEKADKMSVPIYMVLPQKTLMDVVSFLPVTSKALLEIKGFGKKRVMQIGEEIIQLISDYCKENGVESHEVEEPIKETHKPKKQDTKLLTYELYKAGKSIEEICAERDMAVSTIESHLSHFVGTGELDINQFVNKEKVELITNYFASAENSLLGSAKTALGDKVTYGELRLVLSYLEFLERKV